MFLDNTKIALSSAFKSEDRAWAKLRYKANKGALETTGSVTVRPFPFLVPYEMNYMWDTAENLESFNLNGWAIWYIPHYQQGAFAEKWPRWSEMKAPLFFRKFDSAYDVVDVSGRVLDYYTFTPETKILLVELSTERHAIRLVKTLKGTLLPWE